MCLLYIVYYTDCETKIVPCTMLKILQSTRYHLAYIYGGTVTAESKKHGAGIGGGDEEGSLV